MQYILPLLGMHLMPGKAGITTLKSDYAFGRFKGKVYTQANYIAIQQELIQVSIAWGN